MYKLQPGMTVFALRDVSYQDIGLAAIGNAITAYEDRLTVVSLDLKRMLVSVTAPRLPHPIKIPIAWISPGVIDLTADWYRQMQDVVDEMRGLVIMKANMGDYAGLLKKLEHLVNLPARDPVNLIPGWFVKANRDITIGMLQRVSPEKDDGTVWIYKNTIGHILKADLVTPREGNIRVRWQATGGHEDLDDREWTVDTAWVDCVTVTTDMRVKAASHIYGVGDSTPQVLHIEPGDQGFVFDVDLREKKPIMVRWGKGLTIACDHDDIDLISEE